jgi:hypothetical protein
MIVMNRGKEIHTLSRIRTHGLSLQAIEAYVSDRAATQTDRYYTSRAALRAGERGARGGRPVHRHYDM